jgi:hypothetical protein
MLVGVIAVDIVVVDQDIEALNLMAVDGGRKRRTRRHKRASIRPSNQIVSVRFRFCRRIGKRKDNRALNFARHLTALDMWRQKSVQAKLAPFVLRERCAFVEPLAV